MRQEKTECETNPNTRSESMPELWPGDKMIKCDGRITKNFTLKELANVLAKEEVDLRITPEFIFFINMAQQLRDFAASTYDEYKNSGLLVSSCYRTAAFNKSIGGDVKSLHLQGRAIDITNIKPQHYDQFITAWRAICIANGRIGGTNTYSWGMHFDDYEDYFGHSEFIVREFRK